MLTDEEIIEIIAKRMSCEVGWSEASKVFNHFGFVDVVTFLYSETTLRPALLEYYKGDIASAMALNMLTDTRQADEAEAYAEWKADVATRGGC